MWKPHSYQELAQEYARRPASGLLLDPGLGKTSAIREVAEAEGLESTSGDGDGEKNATEVGGPYHRSSFPGLGGEPPLRIEASSLVVECRSDSHGPREWGYRLVVFGGEGHEAPPS